MEPRCRLSVRRRRGVQLVDSVPGQLSPWPPEENTNTRYPPDDVEESSWQSPGRSTAIPALSQWHLSIRALPFASSPPCALSVLPTVPRQYGSCAMSQLHFSETVRGRYGKSNPTSERSGNTQNTKTCLGRVPACVPLFDSGTTRAWDSCDMPSLSPTPPQVPKVLRRAEYTTAFMSRTIINHSFELLACPTTESWVARRSVPPPDTSTN